MKTPSLGRNIAMYRKKKKWTQEMLARETGLSRGYIAAIEEGRRVPRAGTLAIIAQALGVDIKTLKGGK